MTTVKRTLIGFQVLTLSLGMTVFVVGCGGSSSTSSTGGMPIEEQVKQTENAKSAMDAASKGQKVPKK